VGSCPSRARTARASPTRGRQDRPRRAPNAMSADPRLGGIAVLGGGIAGLAAAHMLAARGGRVTLFEASERLGGLGTFFEHGGVSLERFYHCMLPSDAHLLALLRDLDLERDVYWKDTSFGLLRDGRLYGLNTPADLLRFAPLPWTDRLRVGITGAWGGVRPATGLDGITCEAWLSRLSGRRAFETFWRPMLEAKFGDRYRDVPALWFWRRFNREKGGGRERKGYLRGGYRRIVEALARSIEGAGGTIRLRAPVERIDLDGAGRPTIGLRGAPLETFDRVVVTAPVAALRPMAAGGRLEGVFARIDPIDMQGVVNAVLVLRRGLTPHYWVATTDAGVPFHGIVESTTLIDRADVGGAHLLYLTRYLHRTDADYALGDDEVLERWLAALTGLFPDLSRADVIDGFVFRAPFVEPLYTVGYAARKPPEEPVAGRVYLAGSAQVYPEVTSWNGSTALAGRVVRRLVDGARAVP